MSCSVKKISPNESLPQEEQDLYVLLDKLGISYDIYSHEPVFTVEQGADLKKHIPGRHTKNLFLTNKTGQYWHVLAADDTRADLKGLSDKLETKRFSFGKPEALMAILNVEPGHVNPCNLRFDSDKRIVAVILDAELEGQDLITFHPWRNDKTIVMSFNDLVTYIGHIGHPYRVEKLS